MRISYWSSDVCSSDLRYGADGSTQGVEFAVPLADGIPAVAMAPAGDFVVSSSSYDAVAGRYRIQFQLYAADGSTRGAATEVASYSKDRKSTRLHSSHQCATRMPASAGKKKHTVTQH